MSLLILHCHYFDTSYKLLKSSLNFFLNLAKQSETTGGYVFGKYNNWQMVFTYRVIIKFL